MPIFSLLLAIPLTMAPSDTVTVEQVMAAYEETFEVAVHPMGDDTLFAIVVPRELDDDNPLAAFEGDNGFFLALHLFPYLLIIRRARSGSRGGRRSGAGRTPGRGTRRLGAAGA